jgi:hypothetical protein
MVYGSNLILFYPLSRWVDAKHQQGAADCPIQLLLLLSTNTQAASTSFLY